MLLSLFSRAEFYASRAVSLDVVGRVGEALEDRETNLRLQKRLKENTM